MDITGSPSTLASIQSAACRTATLIQALRCRNAPATPHGHFESVKDRALALIEVKVLDFPADRVLSEPGMRGVDPRQQHCWYDMSSRS